MTETAKALYQFFSGFTIPAYVEYSPPENAVLPYITYQVVEPDFGVTVPFYARVWYRGTSFEAINAKVDQIRSAIGRGAQVPTQNGAIWIYRDDQFAQNMPMEGDDTLKCVYLSMQICANVE